MKNILKKVSTVGSGSAVGGDGTGSAKSKSKKTVSFNIGTGTRGQIRHEEAEGTLVNEPN